MADTIVARMFTKKASFCVLMVKGGGRESKASFPLFWPGDLDKRQERNMGSISVLGVVVFIAAIMIYRFLISKKQKRHYNLPPAPPALPLLGHLHLLGKHPHQSLQKLAKKHGPIMSIWLGNIHTVIASSPIIASQFLRTHDLIFANRPHTEVSLELSYNAKNLGLAPYGPYWRYLRRVCSMQVFNPKVFASFESIRVEEMAVLVGSLWEMASRGEEAVVRDELLRLSNNVICRMALGKRLIGCADTESIRELIRESFRLVGAFNVGDYVACLKWLDLQGYRRAARKTAKELDTVIQKLIDEHKQRLLTSSSLDPPRDIVDVLLSVHEEKDAEIRMTDESIKAVVLDMFAAGTETTAMSTEWALAEVVRRPDLMRKAQDELDRVVGRERRVEEGDLAELKYLEAVVKESMRLHPVVPLLFPHMSSEEVSVAGYKIPAGTRLFVNAWAIGRDETVWESALEFKPERFLLEGEAIDVLGYDFRVIPFGSGRRGCPGNTMGFTVVSMAVATLLHGFSWPTDNNLSMDDGFGLTVPMDIPLRLHLTPRLPACHPYYTQHVKYS